MQCWSKATISADFLTLAKWVMASQDHHRIFCEFLVARLLVRFVRVQNVHL